MDVLLLARAYIFNWTPRCVIRLAHTIAQSIENDELRHQLAGSRCFLRLLTLKKKNRCRCWSYLLKIIERKICVAAPIYFMFRVRIFQRWALITIAAASVPTSGSALQNTPHIIRLAETCLQTQQPLYCLRYMYRVSLARRSFVASKEMISESEPHCVCRARHC